MARGDDVTLKSRRITFDDFTSSYIVEKKVDTVQRLCRQRTMHAETLNRGENKFKESKIKMAGKSHQIYNMRYLRERESSRVSLQDMVSHKQVLNSISRLNDADPAWNHNFGRYGPGASKVELTSSIEEQKKKMGSIYRRKQEAAHHLRLRRPMPVMDQSMSTEAFLARWRAPRWRSSDSALDSRAQRTRRLPPISASRSLQHTPGRGAPSPRGLDSPLAGSTGHPPASSGQVKQDETARLLEIKKEREEREKERERIEREMKKRKEEEEREEERKREEEEEENTVAPLASRGPSNVFITQKSYLPT